MVIGRQFARGQIGQKARCFAARIGGNELVVLELDDRCRLTLVLTEWGGQRRAEEAPVHCESSRVCASNFLRWLSAWVGVINFKPIVIDLPTPQSTVSGGNCPQSVPVGHGREWERT